MSYKGLSEEHWNFLVLMAQALRGKQIYSLSSKRGRGYYIQPVIENERISEIKNFRAVFSQAYHNDLKIPLKIFMDLVGNGYFEQARAGNYYLIEGKIFPAVDDYFAHENKAPIDAVLPVQETDDEFHCDIFMVMPFRDGLNDVYDNIIVPLSRELSLSIKRGDERQRASASIVDEVLAYIKSAKIILVDCTELEGKPNGNVYYELGYADALGYDNVIIISQTDATTLPFDVRHRGVIHYKDNAKGIGKLREDLKKEIQSILGN